MDSSNRKQQSCFLSWSRSHEHLVNYHLLVESAPRPPSKPLHTSHHPSSSPHMLPAEVEKRRISPPNWTLNTPFAPRFKITAYQTHQFMKLPKIRNIITYPDGKHHMGSSAFHLGHQKNKHMRPKCDEICDLSKRVRENFDFEQMGYLGFAQICEKSA